MGRSSKNKVLEKGVCKQSEPMIQNQSFFRQSNTRNWFKNTRIIKNFLHLGEKNYSGKHLVCIITGSIESIYNSQEYYRFFPTLFSVKVGMSHHSSGVDLFRIVIDKTKNKDPF